MLLEELIRGVIDNVLELSFLTIELREICEDDAVAQKKLGDEVADALRRRLGDIQAATNIYDVLIGNLRLDPTEPDGSVQIVDLANEQALRVKAGHAALPKGEDGMVDWESVYRIQIIGLVNLKDFGSND